MARLTDDQWATIRAAWEYSPDELSYSAAAEKASEKHGFTPPTKQSVSRRATAEKWERKASLSGVNQAAHRIADRMVESDGSKSDAKSDGVTAKNEVEERSESERKRAEVRARHRQEWLLVAQLRQEALLLRLTSPEIATSKMKLAKITAETTAIQQRGECVAWGLDELVDPAKLRELSDEQLDAIIYGKR